MRSHTPYGGADIGEVVTTAERVKPGDGESCYLEWRALADQPAASGDECGADGHAAAEGAGEHCHEGALTLFHQRMFD